MNVLLIDDDEDMRTMARMSLEDLGGMRVAEATGGAEGVRLAIDLQPDLILLDLVMPEMDGEATLRALLADPRTSAVPVVILTGSESDSEARQLITLGARGVIRKPFDPLALFEEVGGYGTSGPRGLGAS